MLSECAVFCEEDGVGRPPILLSSCFICHLSTYALSIEQGTLLQRKIQSNELAETDEDTFIAEYEIMMQQAHAHGFEHYEISNFALPGFESRHNSGYWNNTPYLGIGPGAHSFNGTDERQYNEPRTPQNFSAFSYGFYRFLRLARNLGFYDFCTFQNSRKPLFALSVQLGGNRDF